MEAVENMDHYNAKDNDNDKTEEELSESGGTTSSTTESDVSDVEVDSNDEDPFAWDKQVCHLFCKKSGKPGVHVAYQRPCLFPIYLACSTLLYRHSGLINDQCIQRQIKQYRFEPWTETFCYVLRQNTLFSHCLSPPRCLNGYRQI